MFFSSQKYEEESVHSAIKNVESMDSDMGGTQIYDPLKSILDQKVINKYPRQIYLLTDGRMDRKEDVIDMICENIKYSRVHGIGIGSDAD